LRVAQGGFGRACCGLPNQREQTQLRSDRDLIHRPTVGLRSRNAVCKDRGDIDRLPKVAIDVFSQPRQILEAGGRIGLEFPAF
jgi:hypothetical protein